MKQPKNDDRPEVLSPDITKAQHIVPAYIIKKWKQDDILLTKIKNNPKLQKISNERNKKGLFCVYHRWVQLVEKQKEKIENAFHKLVSEIEKEQSNLVIDGENQKEQEIILNYFHTMMTCNSFKYKYGNSYVKLNLPSLDKEEEHSMKKRIQLYEKKGYDRDYFEKSGISYIDDDFKIDMSDLQFGVNVYQRTHFYVYENKNDQRAKWYFIKTKERLYLPDCYKPLAGMNNETVGIINVSPHSILISQHFINTYLSIIAKYNNFDLLQLDINYPPTGCKKVISFTKIINNIALNSYDKWIIF